MSTPVTTFEIITIGSRTRSQCNRCQHIFADDEGTRVRHERDHLRDDVRDLTRKLDDVRMDRARQALRPPVDDIPDSRRTIPGFRRVMGM